MTDPRVSLGIDAAAAAGAVVTDALDRTRPIVRVDPNLPPAGATAAAAFALMVARVYPHTELDGDAALGPNPWGAATVADALAKSSVRVISSRDPDTDIVVGVGNVAASELYVSGDDWTASLGTTAVAVTASKSGLGVHAAAALAAAEVNKRVLMPLGMRCVLLPSNFVWNLLNHQLAIAPDPGPRPRAKARLAVFGCGSVGSSCAAVLVCVDELAGEVWPVDPDSIDPSRNPYRYPALIGTETGPKADWVADLLRNIGWTAHPFVGDVGAWVAAQPAPGVFGVAVSSVDTVEGRRDVADALALTTLTAGVAGLALHVQVEHPADDLQCPYCQFLDVRSALEQSQILAATVGLPVDRIVQLIDANAVLTAQDIEQAIARGKVHPDNAQELVGRRLADLVRRAYAEAAVPIADQGAKPAAVSAPYVSWLAGVLLASEVDKQALGLPLLDRRADVDLSGLPLGVTSRHPRDTSGKCLCAQPIRRQWAQRLYA